MRAGGKNTKASRRGEPAAGCLRLERLDHLHVALSQRQKPFVRSHKMENGIDQIAELNKNPAEAVDNPRANSKKVA